MPMITKFFLKPPSMPQMGIAQGSLAHKYFTESLDNTIRKYEKTLKVYENGNAGLSEAQKVKLIFDLRREQILGKPDPSEAEKFRLICEERMREIFANKKP